jgi:hypothetical protein
VTSVLPEIGRAELKIKAATTATYQPPLPPGKDRRQYKMLSSKLNECVRSLARFLVETLHEGRLNRQSRDFRVHLTGWTEVWTGKARKRIVKVLTLQTISALIIRKSSMNARHRASHDILQTPPKPTLCCSLIEKDPSVTSMLLQVLPSQPLYPIHAQRGNLW